MSMLQRSMQALKSNRLNVNQVVAVQAAVRGGFSRPDPQPYGLYKQTRRVHLQDVNTTLYSDFAPEYYMHLHSPDIASSRQGLALVFIYFCCVIAPLWSFARWVHLQIGSLLTPALRPGPQHAHMAPALHNHLKTHNYETMPDRFGRRNAEFYKNPVRQVMSGEHKPLIYRKLATHGFMF